MQELSRGLAESVDDLSSIRALLEDLTRDSEAILVEQSRTNADLQRGLMQTRMLPFSRQLSRFKRVVRQTARELGKRVELEIIGEDTQLDRHILNRMLAPIEHMLRNAVDHGIESAPLRAATGKSAVAVIRLSLARDGAEVVIELSDDGRGMDRAAIRARAIERGLLAPDAIIDDEAITQFALEPAVSTASEVTQISGRGVGLDVVNTEIKQLGGSLHIATEAGVGTTFTIRLPFTLAINQALMASVSQETFAIPLINVDAVVRYSTEELEQVAELDVPALTHSEMEYRYVSLAALLGLESESSVSEHERYPVVLLRAGDYRMALLVDELVGRHEVVVKPIGPQLSGIGWIAGATVMPDGKVVLVLDVPTLIRMGMNQEGQSLQPAERVVAEESDSNSPLVMVVDDSITVRRVTDRFLSRNGMRVVTAKDGFEALSLLQLEPPDLMLLDIEMPRMDGFELATTIRNESHFGHFPIVMITSRTGSKHSERAQQIGVDRYLGKPYQERELLDTINELLGVEA
jgi:chemosensory pili system protein ChpA (sensor histidine kinase/response regulator)